MIDPETGRATRFSSTNQPKNKNGRKPSKLKKFIKDNNLSGLDVGYAIKMVMAMSQSQLELLIANEKKPMLIRLFARAFLTDFLKGTLGNWDALMRRAFGDPVQSIDMIIEPSLSHDERLKRIEELINKRNLKEEDV